ncbi:CPBP family intramembrane metalloprotease, partial [Thioclava sp. BHET1]
LAGACVVKGLPDPATMGFILFNTLLVGFSEEVMCRGILFGGLRDRLPIWPALLIATVIFGGVHVLNGFVTGSFLGATIQAGAATVTGLVLMALRLRTGSLWPVILYHAAWDFLSFLVVHGKSGPPKAQDLVLTPDQILGLLAVVAVLVLPNGLYALWLLRNIRRRGDPALRPAGAEGV